MEQFVSLSHCARELGIGRASLAIMANRGRFPRYRLETHRAPKYILSEVRDALRSRSVEDAHEAASAALDEYMRKHPIT